MNKICVIGSINMDLVVNVDEMPKKGQTLIGSNFKEVPGGKGANQAVAASRLGANVCMVGKVGSDGFGQKYKDNHQFKVWNQWRNRNLTQKSNPTFPRSNLDCDKNHFRKKWFGHSN